uniref:Uncharacterized protein n=1 Tax=Panagrolaimus sp. ES5 TaxID=591445 RepID=A0AC34GGI8_9BILA
MLIAANLTVFNGELVLVLLIGDTSFGVAELKYTKNGYELIRHQNISDIQDIEKLREKILGTNEFYRILLCCDEADSQILKTLKDVFKAEAKKCIVLTEMYDKKYDGGSVIAEAKWILDNKETKFHVLPTCARICAIGYECGDAKHPVLAELHRAALPYEDSVIVPKSCFNYFVSFFVRCFNCEITVSAATSLNHVGGFELRSYSCHSKITD